MLVTCICPTTAARLDWLPKAIACFHAQSWPSKELLIVADYRRPVGDLYTSAKVRWVELMSEPATIGEKRNLCVQIAQGEIVAHFDDDDLSATGRVADQIGRLEASGKAVTGYHEMLFTDGVKSWLYAGPPSLGIGTSLCYRRDWALAHQFPARQVGEDNEFVAAAVQGRQFIAVPGQGMMTASIHPGNTSQRKIGPGTNWREIAA